MRRPVLARLGGSTLSVVAPRSSATVPGRFRTVVSDRDRRELTLSRVQRFRGRVYLDDGAIPADALDSDGRHRSAVDECS